MRNYSHIATSLSDMFKKGNFDWTMTALQAFKQLKIAVTSAPILVFPILSKPFIVECDVSGSGVGVVLLQEGKPTAFFSGMLKGRARLYLAFDRELLALVLAVQKWKSYLIGQQFVVILIMQV